MRLEEKGYIAIRGHAHMMFALKSKAWVGQKADNRVRFVKKNPPIFGRSTDRLFECASAMGEGVKDAQTFADVKCECPMCLL